MKILINALGIQDSGGITVLNKMLNEIVDNKKYNFFLFLFENTNTVELYNSLNKYDNLEFKFVKNRGLIHRVLFENLYYYYFSKKNNIDLVYNFSGSAQFLLRNRQLVKVHNLLFYSKKLDDIYFKNKNYKSWLKHILIKRLFFKLMLKLSKNIEIQSHHVKDNLKDYLNISKKNFFLKNDFLVDLKKIKKYDFSKKITFIYIVGPHFKMLHKNIQDFTKAMTRLEKDGFNFDIMITVNKADLNSSGLWNRDLNAKTKFLGYISKEKIEELFKDNSILISTSVIETLGLHVIESILNGILTIVPNENYSKIVYGNNISVYNLFEVDSLIQIINEKSLLSNYETSDIIRKNQEYLIKNENMKYSTIINIFDKILKDFLYVQR